MTQEYCLDRCKSAQSGEYAYAALQEGTKCYCGNMPPKEEKYAECRVPCAARVSNLGVPPRGRVKVVVYEKIGRIRH